MVRSRLINQISPLSMEWLAIQPRERGQFRVGGVIGKKRLGGLRQPIGAVFYRALQLLAQLMHGGFDNLQPLRCWQLLQLLKDFSGKVALTPSGSKTRCLEASISLRPISDCE